MSHVVLLGDSIFDNAFYVPGEPAVIDQVQAALRGDWTATLVAVDGNVTIDVPRQLEQLPADATHLAISVGGNDALRHSAILGQSARSVGDVLRTMSGIQVEFQREYRAMLEAVLAWRPAGGAGARSQVSEVRGQDGTRSVPATLADRPPERHGGRSLQRDESLPTVVCTIYDAIPELPREAVAALAFFNDVITREASRAGVPVLDLRVLCRDKADYSPLSPIEPSAIGGAKIAEALARFITTHDFSRRECVVFC